MLCAVALVSTGATVTVPPGWRARRSISPTQASSTGCRSRAGKRKPRRKAGAESRIAVMQIWLLLSNRLGGQAFAAPTSSALQGLVHVNPDRTTWCCSPHFCHRCVEQCPVSVAGFGVSRRSPGDRPLPLFEARPNVGSFCRRTHASDPLLPVGLLENCVSRRSRTAASRPW